MVIVSWLADFTISNHYIRDECFTCKNKTEIIYFYIRNNFLFVDFRCQNCPLVYEDSLIIYKTNSLSSDFQKDLKKIMLLL